MVDFVILIENDSIFNYFLKDLFLILIENFRFN